MLLYPWLAAVLSFASPASPRQLVTDEALFEPFGQAVAKEVAQELAHPQQYPDSALTTLLTIEVHWAIHQGDARTALDAADRIRARLTQPEQKAYAGVATQALVAADQAVHQRRSPEYRARFRSEFAQRLSTLPTTPKMRALLIEQRRTIERLTPEILLHELETHIPPGSHRAGYSLEQANEIIRARHKLADLAPLLPDLLSALDEAIAARGLG